jgi:membrane protein YdbS with pleckstrin-like domain
MIEIVCDNCERPFVVDPDRPDGKASCPLCGDVNRIRPESPDQQRSAVPPASNEVEQEIVVVRPAMFRAHPFRYSLLVLLFIGGIVGAIFGSISVWLVAPCLIVSLGVLGYFGWWWMSTHWWVKLVITDKRSIRHEGIVRRHTTEVLHNHVRSVDIEQSFIDRILRVGNIGIDSAGQDHVEIEIQDIPGPYQVKKTIDQYRKM